jgi:hypothetical protein
MNRYPDVEGPESPQTPVIEQGVPGPRNETGFLLRAPPSAELSWDIETEVGSARRSWLEERQTWWFAASYLDIVIALVLRSFPSVLVLGDKEDRLLSRDGFRALQERLF